MGQWDGLTCKYCWGWDMIKTSKVQMASLLEHPQVRPPVSCPDVHNTSAKLQTQKTSTVYSRRRTGWVVQMLLFFKNMF